MDQGAWEATVHGVTKSRTRLSNFTFTFHFHALEKETATHSSVLAWRIPGMGEPGGLLSTGSHRVRHDWSDLAAVAALWPVASLGGTVVKNPPANAGNTRDSGLIPGLGRSPGEGNGNPLQYSCLENPMDRGAWEATVYGVTKSQTRLSDFTSLIFTVEETKTLCKLIRNLSKVTFCSINNLHRHSLIWLTC